MHRSMSCPENNKTAMCNFSATVLKQPRRKRIHKQNLATDYCSITVMCHNTCQITGGKATEIKHRNTFQSLCNGGCRASGQGEVQLPVQTDTVGQLDFLTTISLNQWTKFVTVQALCSSDCRPCHATLRNGALYLSQGYSIILPSGSGAYELRVQILHRRFNYGCKYPMGLSSTV